MSVLITIDLMYLILSQGKYTQMMFQTKCCFVCVLFVKIIVCKEYDFLAFKANENLIFCTMMYRMATPNGIDCCNNQTLFICVATIPFDWMGLNYYI